MPKPTLADLLYARDGCRAGLIGLSVEVRGQVFSILSTSWHESGRLVLRLAVGPDRELRIFAEDCRLVDRWPATCCRPSRTLLREVLAKRAVEAGRLASSRKGGR